MTRAGNLQIKRDVAPAWECVPWKVRFYRRRSDLPKDCLSIVIFDNADCEPSAEFGRIRLQAG